MRSGDGDRPAAVHQQRQDVAAMHDADAPLVRRDEFGVVGLYGAGVHHGVGATHVVGLLADFDGDAEGSQPFGLRAFLTVGTVDVDATLMEHFGEHAHTGATDADEMGPSQLQHRRVGRERDPHRVEDDRGGIGLRFRHCRFSLMIHAGHHYGHTRRQSERRITPVQARDGPWCRRRRECRTPMPCRPARAAGPVRRAATAHGTAPTAR